jgi:hypothetical protein
VDRLGCLPALSGGHDIAVVDKCRIEVVDRGIHRMAPGMGIAVGEELRIVFVVEEGMNRRVVGWGIVAIVDIHHIVIVEGDLDRMVAVEDHHIELVVVHSIVARCIRTADKGETTPNLPQPNLLSRIMACLAKPASKPASKPPPRPMPILRPPKPPSKPPPNPLPNPLPTRPSPPPSPPPKPPKPPALLLPNPLDLQIPNLFFLGVHYPSRLD